MKASNWSRNIYLESKVWTTQISRFQSQQLGKTREPQIPQVDIARKLNAMLIVQNATYLLDSGLQVGILEHEEW